ncbi:glycosyltransferase family protein [Photobacterium iliopiscarium]|jgi:hypothetical protein|uniref:hypothetical protein n=1 Tax=Photobacterium iliopiscarium TaxID=56192 RepID=UPI000D175402|nr:hypothetical protein [Photobacterium iliopiscarium]PST87781.1 hypothetical protein C9I87_17745 [Photobacterium iliopiscarium]PSU01199.1 hypothetical protein C9I85_03330 [Photobacterium iliopiscarium]PSV83890.1 hypothetical protein C9J51_07305 [Photobacterium iliopiscarium]
MKIIIPVVGFSRSGGERVLSKIASELVDLGCDVSFVVLDNKGDPYYPTKAKIKKVRAKNKGLKLFKVLSNIYNLIMACRKENADVIISGLNVTAYLALFINAKIKKVYYIQAYEVLFYKSIVMKTIVYMTYKLPLQKIVNSSNLLPSNINKYIGIIPAGVDTTLFHLEIKTNKNIKKIGIIGRKEKHKGTIDIIKIITKIPKDKEFILNIAVYLDDECKCILRENNISYEYFPIESDDDLACFYRKNDLLIACGLIEDGAFHYPCAEGMASGCIVISNYSPLCELESNFKIDTFNEKELLDKIEYYYSLNDDEIKKEINSNVEKISEFSWDIIGNDFYKLINK